ncbi:MAG TPA: phosphoribosylformylglycinamidine synthase subunit PurQ [Bacteroidetes bacterium]|nr:phosphoribosylformylglycinamidine synthase subunit PurQ [Bacteroidota bacterium]
MRFGVVIFPGSNCDHDMIYTLEHIMKQKVEAIWHKETSLNHFKKDDWIMLPGGFSYGDYLRSGAIARFSPIMKEVIGFANSGGHVMGICNGFQILCESGLLPGVLKHNDNQKFICKNVFIKAKTNSNILTRNINTEQALKIPIAHGEGNYYIGQDGLNSLKDNDQILFEYCDNNASVTKDANPNGSLENIAGICNTSKNVFGMMPHPERASDTVLGNSDGRLLFESILENTLETV